MEKIKINDELEILILNDRKKFLDLIPKNEKKEILELTDLNREIYLKNFENLFFVFFYRNNFLGFILIDIPKKVKTRKYENKFIFFDYYISEKFRGKGFSKILIKFFEEEIIPYLFKNKIIVDKKNFCIKATVEKNNLVSKKIISEKLKMRPYLELRSEIRFKKCFN